MSLHITTNYSGGKVIASANVHDIKSMKMGSGSTSSWLTIRTRDDSTVALHVDGRLAEMLAEAFDEYENWLSSQEGPTYDEALGAKCAALTRADEARALK